MPRSCLLFTLVARWASFSPRAVGQNVSMQDAYGILKPAPKSVAGTPKIMLGVHFGWREQERDAAKHERLHDVLKLADIISPWSVGRYHKVDFGSGGFVANQVEDPNR